MRALQNNTIKEKLIMFYQQRLTAMVNEAFVGTNVLIGYQNRWNRQEGGVTMATRIYETGKRGGVTISPPPPTPHPSNSGIQGCVYYIMYICITWGIGLSMFAKLSLTQGNCGHFRQKARALLSHKELTMGTETDGIDDIHTTPTFNNLSAIGCLIDLAVWPRKVHCQAR